MFRAKTVDAITAPLKKIVAELQAFVDAKVLEGGVAYAEAERQTAIGKKAEEEAELARLSAANIEALFGAKPEPTPNVLSQD